MAIIAIVLLCFLVPPFSTANDNGELIFSDFLSYASVIFTDSGVGVAVGNTVGSWLGLTNLFLAKVTLLDINTNTHKKIEMAAFLISVLISNYKAINCTNH